MLTFREANDKIDPRGNFLMSDGNQQTACKQCGDKIDVDALACPGCGEPRAPRPDRRFEGVEISGKYLVKSRIARGGMGEVYRAEHKEMRQSVAVKFLHRRFAEDEGFARRFLNEARYAGRVSHPNAVRLFDFGKLDDGTLYMIMEFVRGRCLTDIVDELQMLPINMAVRVGAQVAEVLASAHELRIIHRDVKPDNIMLVRTPGGRFSVKVLDFGIAKVLDESDSMQTETGVMFGTPEYMSPEQASGKKVDQRSDVYSLGLVLYFMLAGSPPFHGKNKLRIIHQQAREEPDPVEMRARQPLPPALIELIGQMLSKDPELRPQRMLEVFRRLEEMELRDTSSFEEARSQSAMFKIGSAGTASEALPTARTDQSVAASHDSASNEVQRSSTQGFAPLVRTGGDDAGTNNSSRIDDIAGAGRSGRSETSNPHRRHLTPSMSGAHVSPEGIRRIGAERVAGVSVANTQRRQLGDRGPLRDFASQMPITAAQDEVAPEKRSAGRVPMLIALSIAFACIGGAGWYGMNFYGQGESEPLLTLSSPESLMAVAGIEGSGAEAIATQPDEEAADLQNGAGAGATTDSVQEEAPSRNENVAARADRRGPSSEATNTGAATTDTDTFDDELGRARTLIASARVDDAREQLRRIQPSGDEQTAELSGVRDQLAEIERLHSRLGTALENANCEDAESIARELSSTGGSHHVSRWRRQIRSCEAPSAATREPAAAQPPEPSSAPTAETRGSQQPEPDNSEQTPTPARSDAAAHGEEDAPGGLPGDLDAPGEQPPPTQEAPTREPEPSRPEPAREAPRTPAPVMPPSEL